MSLIFSTQGRKELVPNLKDHCTTKDPFSIASLKGPWLRFVVLSSVHLDFSCIGLLSFLV